MTKSSSRQAGFGLIGILVFLAVVFALINLYSYFNPSFSLAKYSPLVWLKSHNDDTRKKNLAEIQVALEKYYEEKGNYPAGAGWCGRITTVTNSEVLYAIDKYFSNSAVPQDPAFRGTSRDYFYAKLEGEHYVLMASLETAPSPSGDEADLYNFEGCHDWPGENIYNYRLDSLNN